MKITGIKVYQIDLPLHEGRYQWSEGKSVEVFDSTVVEILTDTEIKGYGEVCPLGPVYLPAYAGGVRAGLKELAPALIGQDPTQLLAINNTMDRNLKGHPYVKSPIDMACWDIAGKVAGMSVSKMLGGRFGDDFSLYRAITQLPPKEMAENVKKYRNEGYRIFQLKVGGDPDTDIERIFEARNTLKKGDKLIADANTGWTVHVAARIVNSVNDLDVYIEQPCPTYGQCLNIRQRTSLPFVLDESIDSMDMILRAIHDRAMDVVNLKISKLGGLTKTRQIRDLCINQGIAMTLEDTWGGDIVTSAIAHLAHSTPTKYHFSSTDFNSYVTRSIARGAPRKENGRLSAPEKAGLGIEPIPEVLGKPVLEFNDK